MTPPHVVDAGPVVLRRWQDDWAPALLAAVRASLPQLQAYMAWATDDYAIDSARKFLDDAARRWEEETEFSYAMQCPRRPDSRGVIVDDSAGENVQATVIRRDAANLASARVAERAGYAERERRPSTLDHARGQTDVEVIWEHLRKDGS